MNTGHVRKKLAVFSHCSVMGGTISALKFPASEKFGSTII